MCFCGEIKILTWLTDLSGVVHEPMLQRSEVSHILGFQTVRQVKLKCFYRKVKEPSDQGLHYFYFTKHFNPCPAG